jgi:phosphopantetheinyl transferase (holo-ACP synthase)
VTSFVGNDVVDLAEAHNRGRAGRARLVDRVVTAAERDLLQRETEADRGFALLWSAKEAAYKAARKRDPTLVFAPRRWQVEVGPPTPSPQSRAGRVTIDAGTQAMVRWEHGEGWLHCVALLGEPPGLLDQAVSATVEVEADAEFSARERAGFSCAESAAVRSLARRLLQRHGAGAVEIVREPSGPARLPPRVYAAGSPLPGVDLSLSHDGRFVAAVIGVARGALAQGVTRRTA